MKVLLGIIYYTLQWTWGILQNLLGFFIWFALRVFGHSKRHGHFRFAPVTGWQKGGSMGLGMFIFAGKDLTLKNLQDPKTGTWEEHILSHEYGHTVQSAILGPFYLFLIGLPSIIWCNFKPAGRSWRSGKKDYESFFPEKWATRLGVKTEARHRKPEEADAMTL